MLKEVARVNTVTEPRIHDVGNGHLVTQREYDELVVEALGYGPISQEVQLEQRRREQRSAVLRSRRQS